MEDIKITEGTILESLNNKADIDGGNYKGSGLQAVLEETTLGTQGGTLTGYLNFNCSDDVDYTSPTFTDTSTGSIVFKDKNNKRCGQILNYGNTSNNLITRIDATRSVNGTDVTASIYVYVDANGNKKCEIPICRTKATTTSSASTGQMAVIVQNYVSGTSWYRVWSDGWVEQGGTTGTISSGTKTTYLKSFTNTNYSLTTSLIGSSHREQAPSMVKATNGFTIYHNAGLNNGLGWSWYACGY